MNDRGFEDEFTIPGSFGRAPEVVLAEPVTPVEAAPPPPRRRVVLPLLLFLATCVTTTLVYGLAPGVNAFVAASHEAPLFQAIITGLAALLAAGLPFSGPLLTILTCHELGHFLQARRYGVYCSYPVFLPVPWPPLGTMGAVIAMDPRVPNRKALFDIGASGPLAGLVPTLIFLVIGLSWSQYGPIVPNAEGRFGDPLLFRWLAERILGAAPPGHEVFAHPMAFAGWAGLLLTTINLFPIGQLDGGHVFYALLGRRANTLARVLFLAAIFVMVLYWKLLFQYAVIIVLLALMRPTHPPTAQDYRPLGLWRTVLGWLTLAFVPLGFTPTPFIMPG